jgi:chromosomal replication initiation ATPase DnaA
MKRSKTEFYKSANSIISLISELSSTDVLENKRSRDHAEARSVLYTVIREVYDVSLINVSAYMKSRGKSCDHSTIVYSLSNFDIYSMYSKYLKDWKDEIIYKINTNGLR